MKTGRVSRVAVLCLFIGLCGGQSHAAPQDVNFVGVLKAQRYEQPNADLVMLKDDGNDAPIAFETVAFGTALDLANPGAVQVPGGGPSLPLIIDSPAQWGVEQGWDSLLALDSARPDGAYAVSLNTINNGLQTVSVNLAGGAYPPIPKVTGFAVLQSINSAADTSVQWDSMGGTAMDFVLCSVRDEQTDSTVFETPGPGLPGALDGLSTGVVIPAGELPAGHRYRLELLFVKTVDYKTTPAAYCTTIAGYARSVQLMIATTAPAGQSLNAELDVTIPGEGAWNVARNSLVSFRFTRPMDPSYRSIAWSSTGLVPSNFNYEWCDNNRILLCKYNTALPADTQINWSLDLTGFRDANNVPLSGVRSGFFHTSAAAAGASIDATNCFLIKARGYLQTGSSPVVSGMFGCDADVEMPAFNRVKEPLILTIAANATTGRLLPDKWDTGFMSESTYASKSDLDRYFPNGDFSFALNTVADGSKTVTLSLGATDDYPPAPAVTNLTALQTVNPAAPVPISWTTLSGWNQNPAAGSTFIEMEIANDQGNGVFFISPGEGETAANGCTIPAGTLFPGRTYHVSLSFVKVKDIDTTYGFSGAGFRTVTEFTIKTTGAPAMPGVALRRNGAGMSLDLTAAEPFRNYVVETSRDFARWLPQQTVWAGDTQSINGWFDNDAQYLPGRFYRVRDLTAAENQSGWISPNVDIQGIVYADGSHTTAVAGVIVGTTLDGQTMVTDPAGRFFLETATNFNNDPAGQSYSVKVTAGGQTKTYGPFNGAHPRNQFYEWSTGGYGVTGP